MQVIPVNIDSPDLTIDGLVLDNNLVAKLPIATCKKFTNFGASISNVSQRRVVGPLNHSRKSALKNPSHEIPGLIYQPGVSNFTIPMITTSQFFKRSTEKTRTIYNNIFNKDTFFFDKKSAYVFGYSLPTTLPPFRYY